MNDDDEERVCNAVFSRELICAAVTQVVCGSVLNRAEMVDFPSI